MWRHFLFPFCYGRLVHCIHQFSIKIPYICFLFLFFSTFTFTPFSVFYFHFHLTPFLCSLWLWLCTASINVTSRYHAVCLSSLCFWTHFAWMSSSFIHWNWAHPAQTRNLTSNIIEVIWILPIFGDALCSTLLPNRKTLMSSNSADIFFFLVT